MKSCDLPPNYRHVVRFEGCGDWGAVAWPCLSCAIQSIPVGTDRIIVGPISQRHVRRISNTVFTTAYVRTDNRGYVCGQYDTPQTRQINNIGTYHGGAACPHIDITSDRPIPFGRQRSDDVSEAATVASAERYLREVRA